MKQTFFVFILLVGIFYSCANSKAVSSNNITGEEKYKILRINIINDIFIIYAQKQDSLYKILSKKEVIIKPNCRELIIGNSYELELESLYPKTFLGKYDLSPNNLPTVSGIDFHGTKIEIERDSILDLFIAKNLKGLCLNE